MPTDNSTDPALAAGRLAYERHAWGEAYESLTAADAAGDLGAEDLERLAHSRVPHRPPGGRRRASVRAPISRPSATASVELAIRVAFSLGMDLMQRNEMAQAGGWLARAARLIEETGYDGSERGGLLIPEALRSLHVGRPGDRVRDRSSRSRPSPTGSATATSPPSAGSVAGSRLIAMNEVAARRRRCSTRR